MGIFTRKGCAVWSPNFVLSAGFETLFLFNGNDLCELTVMWETHRRVGQPQPGELPKGWCCRTWPDITAGWIRDSVAATFPWRERQCWIHGLLGRVRGHLLVRIMKLGMIQVARDPWRSSPPTSCPKQAWLNSDPGAQSIFQLSFLQAWRVHLFPFLCSSVSLLLEWNTVLINNSLDQYLHLL